MSLLALASTALSVGSSILGASNDKKAAKKADRAQQEAAAKALAAQQENFNRIFDLNNPYVQDGNVARTALMDHLGLGGRMAGGQPAAQPAGGYNIGAKAAGGPAGVSPMSGSAGAQGGGAQRSWRPNSAMESSGAPTAPGMATPPPQPTQDWSAYGAVNPDVAAGYEAYQAGTTEGFAAPGTEGQSWQDWGYQPGLTEEQFYAQHYATTGQGEGREAPAMLTPEADPNAVPDYMNMRRPDAPPMPTFERPDGMSAPALPSVDWQSIQNDPGFQWETGQTTRNVNAGSAAAGRLRGGDAAKALQDRLYGVAHSYGNDYVNRALSVYDRANQQYQYGQNRADNIFADDRAFDMGQWQYGTERQDRNFDTDRGYQTNRWDTQTSNLFDVSRLGLGAAGNVAGAGTNLANASSNIFGRQANSTADRAYATAAANNQMIGSLASGAGNMFANWGGGSGGSSGGFGQTFRNPWVGGSF